MLTQVRSQFYQLLAQQRRVEITQELVDIVRRAKDVAEALRRAGVQAEIDVLAFSIELQRLEAALVQAERILAGRLLDAVCDDGAAQSARCARRRASRRAVSRL